MDSREDFEGRVWVTGNHKWEPVHPIKTHVKCVQCGRIELKSDVRRGGMYKCTRQLKEPEGAE